MHVIVDSKTLQFHLSLMQPAYRVTNVLRLSTSPDRLHLSASTDNMRLDTKLAAQIIADGRLHVSTRKLPDLIASFKKGDQVGLAADNDTCRVSSGHFVGLVPTAADSVSFSPALDNPLRIVCHQNALVSALRNVSYAMSHFDGSVVKAGCLLATTGTHFKAVATDGYRLAVAEGECQGDAFEVVIPSRTVQALSAQSVETTLTVSARGLEVQGEHYTVTSGIMTGFPPYERVIPPQTAWQCVCQREDLLDSLAQLKPVNFIDRIIVSLTPGRITLKCPTDTHETTETYCTAINTAMIEFAVNPKYLADALAAIASSEIFMMGNEPTQPIVLRSTIQQQTGLHLIVPMRR